MSIFGTKFSGQGLLDFALGGYDGLDRRREMQMQDQRMADQKAATSDLQNLWQQPQEAPQLAPQPPGAGPMDAVAQYAQSPAAGVAPRPRVPSKEELFPALFKAAAAGVDISPYTEAYKAMNPDAEQGQYFNTGENIVYAKDGKAESIYTRPAPTAPARYLKVKNPDGSESIVAVGGDGQPIDAQSAEAPAPQFSGSAPGSLADRNNNPGNLRPDGSNWQGMTGTQGGFVQFDTPENGMRAARISLANQAKLHGINTITGLIQKYAPATDGNDPAAYAQTVARMTGIDPNAPIDLTDPAIQDKILPAMFKVEGGGTPSPQPAQAPSGPPRLNGGARVLYTSQGGSSAPTGDLSPEAVKSAADYYKATGLLPPLGMGKAAAANRSAILNAAAAGGPTNIAGNQAANKANVSTLTQLTKQRGLVSGFEKTVQSNLDIVDNLIGSGAGSFGSPFANRLQQYARKEYAGDPQVTAYETALQTVSSEYAKVMSGGMGNGPVSDSARSHARELLNPELTPQQIKANIAVMRQEMANRIDGMDSEIEHTKGQIGTQSIATPPRNGQSAPSSAAPRRGPLPQATDAQHATFKKLFKPGAKYGTDQAPYIVRNKAEYDALKPGQKYIARDGTVGTK